MVFASSVLATTSNDVAKSQVSKNWIVKLDNADTGDNLTKPKRNIYNTFSLDIKSVEKDKSISNISFEVYSDTPESTVKHELVSNQNLTFLPGGYHYSNIPISVESKQIEVVITWKQKDNNKKLRETFIIKL
jgi:hypothetical protein